MHFIFVLLLSLGLFNQPQESGTLTVEITGFRNTDGQLIISIYTPDHEFPRSNYYQLQKVEHLNGKRQVVQFKNLSYGEYAVALLHDENGNEKMDYNWIGKPVEGFGFSNNLRPKLSAPSFKDAKFNFNRNNKKIRIEVVYY